MAPKHGDQWRVNAIQHGERFYYVIRAWDRKEALEVGTAMCLDNGEECISVSKVRGPEEGGTMHDEQITNAS